METEFYLRDTRSNVGTTCMFWAKNGCGYTTDLKKAEVFDFDRAQSFADEKGHFIPLSKNKVDSVATIRVDMQLLDDSDDFSEGMIIHRRVGYYDGNDIFFESVDGESTANYDNGRVFGKDEAELALKALRTSGKILSKAFIDSICRPTLQISNVNHRKMMTAAGIRYRAPRKSRAVSGKTRHNCPCCGKIVWDYNPYEAPFCSWECERGL